MRATASAAAGALLLCCTGLSWARESDVSCGSIIKLAHAKTAYYLHSHQVKWGGGSGQQSVTANGAMDDQGEFWIVKEANGAMPCEVGRVVKCGGTVRLEHLFTQKNLHTHRFPSPLTRLQEVSGFGEDGDGDSGDNWVVECLAPGAEAWARDAKVLLKSADTGRYLFSSAEARFTQQNCPHCPIIGQQEVAAHTDNGENAQWVATQGLFFTGSG